MTDFPFLPGKGGAYVTLKPVPASVDEEDLARQAITFVEWQCNAKRAAREVCDDDREAVAQIICWISRPSRPDISLRHLQAWANHMLIRSTGEPYLAFRAFPKKKRIEIINPMLSLERQLRRGLRAGQMLEHAWSISGGARGFAHSLKTAGMEHVRDPLDASGDERKKLWSQFIPCIHLCMAVRHALIEGGFDVDAVSSEPGSFLSLLLQGGDRQDWVSRALLSAERCSYRLYFQQLMPRPERMLRFRLRDRELAELGGK